MNECFASIIVPVYNSADYLEECLFSALSQTLRDFEIILVDDGSTDGSAEICDGFARNYEQVRVIHQKNSGVSAARNIGISRARGTYLVFLDSDDLLHPQLLSLLNRAQRGTAPLMIGWDMERRQNVSQGFGTIFEETVPVTHETAAQAIRKIVLDDSFAGYVINKAFLRAAIVGTVCFDTEIAVMEDLLFSCQALLSSHGDAGFVYLDAPLYCYRQTPGSAVHSIYSEKNLTGLLAQDRVLALLEQRDDYQTEAGVLRSRLLREICLAHKKLKVNGKGISNVELWRQRIWMLYEKHRNLPCDNSPWSWKYRAYRLLLQREIGLGGNTGEPRVLYFIFQPVDTYPPCISEIMMLRELGIAVSVLTQECDPLLMKQFHAMGVPCHILEVKSHPIRLIQKGQNYLNYRSRVGWFIREYWSTNSVLWLGSEETAIKMWPFVKQIHPCILNALEFYEYRWYQRGMKKIAPQAEILTACEKHRAQYMMDWWKLKRQPYILPNKPYFHPGTPRTAGGTPELRQAIARLRGKKVLLYQGCISPDRDLSLLAAALREADSDYYLALVGKDYCNGVDAISSIYEKTIYLGSYPAPLHLELTAYASIGVAYYQENCINNRYCAPNKIYEYAGCGLPMLCNKIPGLTETVGAAGAAECVDFQDAWAVIHAIQKIDEDYEGYRQAALAFYDATDNMQTVRQIVEDAFSRTKKGRA